MKSVYSAVRTGSLNKAVCASSLKELNNLKNRATRVQTHISAGKQFPCIGAAAPGGSTCYYMFPIPHPSTLTATMTQMPDSVS